MTRSTGQQLFETLIKETDLLREMCASERELHRALIAVRSSEIPALCSQQDARVQAYVELKNQRDRHLGELGHHQAPLDEDHLQAQLGPKLGGKVREQIEHIRQAQLLLAELKARSKDLATQGLALITRVQASPQPKMYRLRGGRIEGTAA